MFGRSKMKKISRAYSADYDAVDTEPPADTHTLFIVLGGTGNLATQKFLPALYRLVSSKIYFKTPDQGFSVLGIGRNQPGLPSNVAKEENDSDDTLYRKQLSEKLTVGDKAAFLSRCFFVTGDLTTRETYNLVAQKAQNLDIKSSKVRTFFVFCGPETLFQDISEQLPKKIFPNEQEKVYYIAQKTTSMLLPLASLRSLNKKFGAQNIYRVNLSEGFGQRLESKLRLISQNPFLRHIFEQPGVVKEVEVCSHSIKPQKGDLLNSEVINHCLPVILTLFDLPMALNTVKLKTAETVLATNKAVSGSQMNHYTYVKIGVNLSCKELKNANVFFEAAVGANENKFEVKLVLAGGHTVKIKIRPNFQVSLFWNELKTVLVSEPEDRISFSFNSYETNVLHTLYLKKTHFNYVAEEEVEQISKLFLPLYQRILSGKQSFLSFEGTDYPAATSRTQLVRKNSKELAMSEFERLHPTWSKIKRQLLVSTERMEGLTTDFMNEMKNGLNGKPSSIKMIPSFVTVLPNGTETGVYFSLDLGGTNFRVSRFEFLEKKGQFRLTAESKVAIPRDAMVSSVVDPQGTVLFDFLADRIYGLLKDDESLKGKLKFGFTFSFPLDQTGLSSGTLLKWTKGFKVDGTEGQDVVELLKLGLERRKPEQLSSEIEIVALVNDTVGTLASGKYDDDRTMIGIILGTGTNAAYIEKLRRVNNVPGAEDGANVEASDDKLMAINMEWGAFGDLHGNLNRIKTEADKRIDRQSINPDNQGFEKMMGGMYLGEIVRQVLVDLYAGGDIFNNILNMPSLSGEYSEAGNVDGYPFQTRFVSMIEYDMDQNFAGTKEVEKLLNWDSSKITDDDRVLLKQVCGAVVERAARLTGVGIVAIWRHLGLEKTPQAGAVGIDGSVFELHPSFQQRLEKVLARLNCDPEVFLAKDGSGKGAALIAAGVEKM